MAPICISLHNILYFILMIYLTKFGIVETAPVSEPFVLSLSKGEDNVFAGVNEVLTNRSVKYADLDSHKDVFETIHRLASIGNKKIPPQYSFLEIRIAKNPALWRRHTDNLVEIASSNCDKKAIDYAHDLMQQW